MENIESSIVLIANRWKDSPNVVTAAKQLANFSKTFGRIQAEDDIESRKNARILWQKGEGWYWDLVWAIVEARIDAGPPESLTFEPAERLFIDYGYIDPRSTTPNDAFAAQLDQPSCVDMYQYNRLTDYIQENYALIFNKPYLGPEGGVSLEEKINRFTRELKTTEMRRKMALSALFAKSKLVSQQELTGILNRLETGLVDSMETDMRTKRIREAEGAEKEAIRDHCKHYDLAERELLALMDSMEQQLTAPEEPAAPEKPDEASPTAAPEQESRPKELILDEDDDFLFEDVPAAKKKVAAVAEEVAEMEPLDGADETDESDLDFSDAGDAQAQPTAPGAEVLDQNLKIIQNVISLHDKTKFLAGLIVHVSNETERWKTRASVAANKFKGQGIPALKMELREGINKKREFMQLAARSGRVDVSPLCRSNGTPIPFSRAGEIMMDLTPLDPEMLRASRIRMYGIPRVILVPGQGLGVYDWTDNSLIVPIFPVTSDIKGFCFALGGFRWDNDEDRTLKDSYALLKANKKKGIRAMQESFYNDYFLWISKERKGYRILPKDVSKWFGAFFKQKK